MMDGSRVPAESRKCGWGFLIAFSMVERSGGYSDAVVVLMSFGLEIGLGDGGGDGTDFALRS